MNTPPPRSHTLTPPRLTPYALPLLLVIVAARFAWEILHALDVFADYHAYYRAAANLRTGADIYTEGKLLVEQNSFDFWTQTDGQYVYPPLLAIALLPLTILDIGKGGPTWLLILTLAAFAFPWLVARCLGRPVGLYSYLIVAFPTWAILPLILGIRYNIVQPLPILLAALTLAVYLAIATGFQHHQHSIPLPRYPITPPSSPQGGYPPQWVRSPRSGGEGSYPATALYLALLLPLLAALILALGWRGGQVDAFLLKLAAPGLVGTALLPLLPLTPFFRATSPRADYDTLLPLAIPVLGATPLLLGLRFGQPDILLLLLTTLALLAHIQRRDVLAGIALGAAAAVKPTLALYGLYFLKKRAWTTLVAATVTGAMLGLAPFLLLGPGAFADWFTISRYFTGDDYPTYPNNQSLRGLLLRAFDGGPRHAPLLTSPLLAQILWFVAAIAALVLWGRVVPAQRQAIPRAVAEYALTAILILFAAPLSEDIHYVALLLPLALLSHHLLTTSHTPRWRTLTIVALLAFLLPIPTLTERITALPALALLASAPYLYGLALVAAALAIAFPHKRGTAL